MWRRDTEPIRIKCRAGVFVPQGYHQLGGHLLPLDHRRERMGGRGNRGGAAEKSHLDVAAPYACLPPVRYRDHCQLALKEVQGWL